MARPKIQLNFLSQLFSINTNVHFQWSHSFLNQRQGQSWNDFGEAAEDVRMRAGGQRAADQLLQNRDQSGLGKRRHRSEPHRLGSHGDLGPKKNVS